MQLSSYHQVESNSISDHIASGCVIILRTQLNLISLAGVVGVFLKNVYILAMFHNLTAIRRVSITLVCSTVALRWSWIWPFDTLHVLVFLKSY